MNAIKNGHEKALRGTCWTVEAKPLDVSFTEWQLREWHKQIPRANSVCNGFLSVWALLSHELNAALTDFCLEQLSKRFF